MTYLLSFHKRANEMHDCQLQKHEIIFAFREDHRRQIWKCSAIARLAIYFCTTNLVKIRNIFIAQGLAGSFEGNTFSPEFHVGARGVSSLVQVGYECCSHMPISQQYQLYQGNCSYKLHLELAPCARSCWVVPYQNFGVHDGTKAKSV